MAVTAEDLVKMLIETVGEPEAGKIMKETLRECSKELLKLENWEKLSEENAKSIFINS